MSQNKTVIPGLEPNEGGSNNYRGSSSSNFYSRGAQAAPKGGTVVPGMQPNMGGYQQGPAQTQQYQQQPPRVISGKPVVGFLYSVSRTLAGEYWPLYIGQNTIGKSPSCNICLKEGTISEDHAVLVVRKMKNPEKVIASISDARSTNGTMLNGQSLGFSAEECHNGDIITIGDNYELYLILVDAPTLGLKAKENFIAIGEAEDEENEMMEDEPYFPGSQRPTRTAGDLGGPTPPPFNGGGYNGPAGTVGLDGSTPFNDKGGTVGL